MKCKEWLTIWLANLLTYYAQLYRPLYLSGEMQSYNKAYLIETCWINYYLDEDVK
jgi:hypothetical protein